VWCTRLPSALAGRKSRGDDLVVARGAYWVSRVCSVVDAKKRVKKAK
jgi:hypothetical protein